MPMMISYQTNVTPSSPPAVRGGTFPAAPLKFQKLLLWGVS
jgi:hypothetical protein